MSEKSEEPNLMLKFQNSEELNLMLKIDKIVDKIAEIGRASCRERV